MKNNLGFTLMEVLVATAICAIAIGVTLSGISQGHRSTFRAHEVEQAGIAARIVVDRLNLDKEHEEVEGEIPGMEGWTYKVEYSDLSVSVRAKGDNDTAVETGAPSPISGLAQRKVTISSPNGLGFSIISWVAYK